MKLKNNKGVAGVDIAVSVVILTIFISVIAGLFYNIASTSKKIDNKSVATNIAIDIIEKMKALDFNDLKKTGDEEVREEIGFSSIPTLSNLSVPDGYNVEISIEDYNGGDVIKILRVYVKYKNGNKYEEMKLETLKKKTIQNNVFTITNQITSIVYDENKKQISEKVTQTSDNAEIDFSKCKWVYNTQSEKIGTDSSKYTGGTFTKQDEEITVTYEEMGVHYLHILTVDINGNKFETVTRPVVVILTVLNSDKPVSGFSRKLQTETGDLINFSNGKTNVTTGSDGKAYMLFNKIENVDTYILPEAALGAMGDRNMKFTIDLKNNIVMPNDDDYISGTINEYGIVKLTIKAKNGPVDTGGSG